MTLLARAEALIVDLRRNTGGNPEMVTLLSSYLFDEPVHLNTLENRSAGRQHQFWTVSWAPGPRFGGAQPVWVLTSGDTFSAAEEFTYNLQQRGRAVVVGERTRGGANAGSWYRLTDHLRLFVPGVRAVNPVSGTNWEGVGVTPDVPTAAAEALDAAYEAALHSVLARDVPAAVADEARAALAASASPSYRREVPPARR
ncbi:S41 family peptidase [Streptomyces sp. KR80]|uniref:S41 family peptidase n=1 Tax=Streptomyces sp. KR80 TaxID=3457426 RepID=UPI003FD4AECB